MAFPSATTLIDSFPSAGTPPPGWASMNGVFGNSHDLTANGDGTVDSASNAYAGNYKTGLTIGPNISLYARLQAAPSAGFQGIFFAGSDWTSATGNGYLVRWDNDGSTVKLYKFVSGTGSATTGSATWAAASGDYLGVEITGTTTVNVYKCLSANDPTNSANWTLLFTYDASGDGILSGSAGEIGLLSSESGRKWGTVSGGTVSAGGTAPSNTVAPAVTGTPTEGQTLTTDNGTWTDDGSPTFNYQWQRDNSGGGTYTNISAATASTHTLVAADVGCQVRCVVTDTDTNGATAADSNALTAGPLYTGTPGPSGFELCSNGLTGSFTPGSTPSVAGELIGAVPI